MKNILGAFFFKLKLILSWMVVKFFCKKPKYKKKYVVSICAIFKNEPLAAVFFKYEG